MGDKDNIGRLQPENNDYLIQGLFVGKGESKKVFELKNDGMKLCFGKSFLQCAW